jgi:hypothetical protein
MSDQTSDQTKDQTSDPTSQSTANALALRYQGVSAVARGEDSQRVCLFTHSDDAESSSSAQLTIHDPLVFREAMRVFLTLHQPKGSYLPDDPKIYEAYAGWRRTLDPLLTTVELTRSFYSFLGEHDPEAWVGCDPTVSLNAGGLAFETLDPTGRVYVSVSLKPEGFSAEDGSDSTQLSAQFEGGEALQAGLTTLNQSAPLTLSLGAGVDEVKAEYTGEITKTLPTPTEWQRNFTQVLAATTRPLRSISMSRMDLYNILQHLRLNADIPKQKSGMRFELIPGKQPALTLEPWGWRHICTGDVYRGDRAEVLGVWDRRDLLIFDALLPYVEHVTLHALGEAQPTFWVLDCGALSFTLATMGFRPNNWSRGVLLDLTLPRVAVSAETLAAAEVKLRDAGTISSDELSASLDQVEDGVSGEDLTRTLIQAGLARPDLSNGMLSARTLFTGLTPTALRYRNAREARGSELADLDRIEMEINELPTGEIEVVGRVTEVAAAHLPVEPVYTPRFQIKEGAGMRKVGCDCAWMKDREKQKSGPCPHVVALWVRYSMDEAKRQAEIDAHPERVERATSVYFKRQRGRELSRIVELRRRQLIERWEDQGEADRHFHRVFPHVAAARAAYFKRVAELERREYMDASQS